MIRTLTEAAEAISRFLDDCASTPSAPTERFAELACALFRVQVETNPVYGRFCQALGVTTVQRWQEIPALPTSAFKSLDVTSIPVAERTACFHSSGTTSSQPGRHYHHAASRALYEQSLQVWFVRHFPVLQESRVISLSPEASAVPHSSLAHMFEVVSRAGEERQFLGRVDATGGWVLEVAQAIARLEEAARVGRPILLLGTAFLYVPLLKTLQSSGRRIPLPLGSCALETGGYKGRTRELPKAELHAMISALLGVSPENVVSEYGMSELSSQAYDRMAGCPGVPLFRFPPWARVQVISPETGMEAGEGECGLIRVVDLANVYSGMAIQTEDIGVRHGEGIELAGRAAGAELRGCSLLAV